MSAISVSAAKTNFGRLLDRVKRGESVVILRHGSPVARLVPFAEPIDKVKVGRAIDGIRALQKTQTLGKGLSIEDLINERPARRKRS